MSDPTEAVRLQLKGLGYSVPKETLERAMSRAGFELVRPRKRVEQSS